MRFIELGLTGKVQVPYRYLSRTPYLPVFIETSLKPNRDNMVPKPGPPGSVPGLAVLITPTVFRVLMIFPQKEL